MRRHPRPRRGRQNTAGLITVDGVVPNPELDHDPLPDQVLGIALDQRASGPRRLMVAVAAYDGRFLALLFTRLTDPRDVALDACLRHFDSLGRGGVEHAAAVVLCDEPVAGGPPPATFTATFERAEVTQEHGPRPRRPPRRLDLL